jgi:aminoglycoside phosphotransferase (APT) family kinase protein
MKKSYTNHLGEIETQNLQLALDKFDLGTLVSAEAITHGLFGQNVSLTTTKGSFIFRGKPRSSGQFEYERYMGERLHAATDVPVPRPYRIDASSELFGWPYVIMPKLPGLSLESPEAKKGLTREDGIEIAGAMGELLREMQRLRNPYCGVYDAEIDKVLPISPVFIPSWEKQNIPQTPAAFDTAIAAANASYPQWLSARIMWFLETSAKPNDQAKGRPATADDSNWVNALLQENGHALREPFEPCFVMDDFKEGNTVVSKVDGKWKVTGVFDLGTSYFGDGEADLSRTLLTYGIGGPHPMERSRAFLQAYLRGQTAETIRPGFLERALLYILMDSAVFWYCFRNWGGNEKSADFRSWFEPMLSTSKSNLTTILEEVLRR